MDNEEQKQIDTQAEMDFKEKTKPFQGEDKEKQARAPSENETMTPDSRHFQQKSDASAVKTSSPCKETEKTNRLKTATVDKEFLEKVKRTLSGKRWTSSLQESPKETLGKNNESSTWSLSDLEVFKHPMRLISAKSEENEDGQKGKIIWKSEMKVSEQIKKIDLPLVVVAVVGPCRTGKSYLMNCLANSFKGGFELGNTTQSQTIGIWVWCKMHPTQKNTVLVLLDTEGLGDVGKGDQNHDTNLFTLTTLLCNCLVYNIKGAFDNEAISKLTFVTEMAKNIKFREKSLEDNQMQNLILPDFVLCMRDCSPRIERWWWGLRYQQMNISKGD
ncbi:protein SEY1 homolog isoform X2 [Ruditapes philippinarum]|uniref:protein SEY1 homolog isoform X2 n=1 Tax=Ruditapes philippinarum TaxID=129788 RepID=UPI00295BFFE9|nr:protein SEY1 homolog isoform X2 [Ruditapes philippinarum]